MSRPVVLVDFDGTATAVDADFALADSLLGERARAVYGPAAEAFERLEIGTRTYFERYLGGLGATPEAIARAALTVALRPGFVPFVAWCAEQGLTVQIISEGLALYIRPLLVAAGLGDLPLRCNDAELREGRWVITSAAGAEPCARCLNCKGAAVRAARAGGAPAVALVGNGASDLCAAREADLVLARDSLLTHCRRLGIDAVPWTDFGQVQRALAAWT